MKNHEYNDAKELLDKINFELSGSEDHGLIHSWQDYYSILQHKRELFKKKLEEDLALEKAEEAKIIEEAQETEKALRSRK